MPLTKNRSNMIFQIIFETVKSVKKFMSVENTIKWPFKPQIETLRQNDSEGSHQECKKGSFRQTNFSPLLTVSKIAEQFFSDRFSKHRKFLRENNSFEWLPLKIPPKRHFEAPKPKKMKNCRNRNLRANQKSLNAFSVLKSNSRKIRAGTRDTCKTRSL